jgi:hypothetical protein
MANQRSEYSSLTRLFFTNPKIKKKMKRLKMMEKNWILSKAKKIGIISGLQS